MKFKKQIAMLRNPDLLKRIVLSVFCVFRKYVLSLLRNTNKHKQHTNVISTDSAVVPTRKIISCGYTSYDGKVRIKLIAIQEEPVKVAPEMESLLRAAIALTNFEIKMVWLKVSHPAVMDCSKKVALPKSPIYLAEQFTPTDLMEIVTSMQGLGVGRCLDGSQASLDMFVESFSWMFNVRINNPNQCKHAILNRKLRLTRFLDLLRGYLIERSQQ